ncbi:MAG: phosphotransferase [Aestuariivita sp.]|uniref:aminoglycoside phosphotransferase family protein n=1 Tax=Aestuariivita sp. TaxID=1872407 RepID=UPI003BB005DF
MTDRSELAARFLKGTEWANAKRKPLAGDASNRRYERLHQPDGTTAVFMDAPPEKGEDVRPFIAIAEYLSSLGLSAPRIPARDTDTGFLILEDLGDDLYARVVERSPEIEETIYVAATDALIALHRADPPDLKPYDAQIMTDLAATAYTRYKAGITGVDPKDETAAFIARFRPVLAQLTGGPQVLIQRDYHAENLLWLPDRAGVARVGMLDFQDAMLGHPAYDLVSILQDARRDVPVTIEAAMIDHYVRATGVEKDGFSAAYAALGTQRNLRILGIFAKLSLDMGKSHYIDLIPRVWGLLQRDLDHPALGTIAPIIRAELPEPTAENLARLKPT